MALLLGNGGQGQWDVSLEDDGLLQIDGANYFVQFRVDRAALPHFPTFFETPHHKEMHAGSFAGMPVTFSWDDEHDNRCFILFGKDLEQVSFCVLGIGDLAEAFRQLNQDLNSGDD